MARFEDYRATYETNWENLKIRPTKDLAAEKDARRIIAGKARYQKIQNRTGVPWWFIGLVHLRESDLDFSTQLGQGDPLNAVSIHEPIGMGPYRGPNAFEDAAYDALKHEKFLNQFDWGIARTAFRLEGYNGYGYHAHGVNSPYLYGGSTVYGPPEAKAGKYVADGKFNPIFVDPQLGTLVVLKKMMVLDPSIRLETTFSDSAKHGTAGAIVVAGTATATAAAHAGMPVGAILTIVAVTVIAAAASWYKLHLSQQR